MPRDEDDVAPMIAAALPGRNAANVAAAALALGPIWALLSTWRANP